LFVDAFHTLWQVRSHLGGDSASILRYLLALAMRSPALSDAGGAGPEAIEANAEGLATIAR
jgi:hypothetical protein